MRRIVLLALAGLALLVGVYCFGRRDAPNRQDALVGSLLDGVKAYNQRNQELERQARQVRLDLAASTKRERALAARRTPTPAVVPASCAPWAENLSTCDQQRGELQSQVEHTGRLLALAVGARVQDSARIDSLTTAVKKARGKDHILGIKLPSRRTSFAAGGILGSLATGGACLLLRR